MLSDRGVRYLQYLGDGDSKGFGAVESLDIYGDDAPITKLECMGHVQKRMGSRPRSLKAKMKGIKLTDGKPLGGKNCLTNGVVGQLQNYYSLAIRRSTASLPDMQRAVWGIFYHKRSTDQDPNHGLCSKGVSTSNLLLQISRTSTKCHSYCCNGQNQDSFCALITTKTPEEVFARTHSKSK